MLCLPMAAMGETYVCEAEALSRIRADEMAAGVVTDPIPLVIDPEKGTRELQLGLEYEGDCEKTDFKIICVVKDSYRDMLTVLTLDNLVYTRALQTGYSGEPMVLSEYGKCTEI